MNKEVKQFIECSDYAHSSINDKITNRASYRWENKPVICEELLWNKDPALLEFEGPGEMIVEDDVITIKENTDVEALNKRLSTTLKIKMLKHDFDNFNRIYLEVNPEAIGFVNFYFHFTFGDDKSITHAYSLTPNCWNKIIFEINHQNNQNIDYLNITSFLFGTPPEAEPLIKVKIKNLKIQKVKPEYELGWNLENRIAYSHVGYFINGVKTAIIDKSDCHEFSIYDEKHQLVYQNKCNDSLTNLGNFQILDFTDFNQSGRYYLQVGEQKTNLFDICDNPYELSIWKSLNFLRELRCGEEVVGVHSACHLNCRTIHQNMSVPNFGGWHDAGDLSQFEIPTAEITHALLDLADSLQNDKSLSKRLLEEAKIGVNWLLRTRFKDGYRALAVSYEMWRHNEITNDNIGINKSVAENGPFENFLASAALAKAAYMYQTLDPIFSDWCKRTAIDDFNWAKKGYEEGLYTKRWGKNIDCVVAGSGLLAIYELSKITNKNDYLNIAKKYGNIIIRCQNIDYSSSMYGYFYEDVNHSYVLTYEHRGHEQTPIQGLIALCETFPSDLDKKHWEKCLSNYVHYIKESMLYTKPYNLLPAHLYELDKFNMERFTVPVTYGTKEKALDDLKTQAQYGIKIDEKAYLRIFPVAIQRRGYHATLLSKTKGVNLLANYFNDDILKNIVINQLEWILGKNPFSTSTMYGEGYNYHPLYVAYSKQMIGALPVGIKTKGYDDIPYWPVADNAVFKEIWGHTTAKYLWILADLLKKKGIKKC